MKIFKNDHIMVFAGKVKLGDFVKVKPYLLKNPKYCNFIRAKKRLSDRIIRKLYLDDLFQIFGKNANLEIKNGYINSINGYQVSVSHSGYFYAFVLSKNPVGIDLELLNKSFDNINLPVTLKGVKPRKEHEFKFKWTVLEAWLKKHKLENWPKELVVTKNKVNKDDLYFFINQHLLITVVY